MQTSLERNGYGILFHQEELQSYPGTKTQEGFTGQWFSARLLDPDRKQLLHLDGETFHVGEDQEYTLVTFMNYDEKHLPLAQQLIFTLLEEHLVKKIRYFGSERTQFDVDVFASICQTFSQLISNPGGFISMQSVSPGVSE